MTTLKDKPDAPTNVKTTEAINGVDIEITWNAANNNGDTVTAYRVMIKQLNGTFSESSACNATSDTTLRDARNCTVSMATLRITPYLLTYGEEVIATVEA